MLARFLLQPPSASRQEGQTTSPTYLMPKRVSSHSKSLPLPLGAMSQLEIAVKWVDGSLSGSKRTLAYTQYGEVVGSSLGTPLMNPGNATPGFPSLTALRIRLTLGFCWLGVRYGR